MSRSQPHAGQPVLAVGPPPAEAPVTVVLLHGRGASAGDILTLVPEVARPELAWLAPQAAAGSWYPNGFLAPLERNQPHLDSALASVDGLLGALAAAGVGAERVVVAGFSQGACLALEYAARHARRFAGVAALTGGLIGPPGTPRDYPGSLAGTPVYLGAGDPDPHVPWQRVEESAEALTAMDAVVTLRRYPGQPHAVGRQQLDELRQLLDRAAAGTAPGAG